MKDSKKNLSLEYQQKYGKQIPEVIISMTTYPRRINTLAMCIKSLINQTFPADRIVLQLAETEFPNKEKDLPEELIQLTKDKVDIEWGENTRPYKKLVPTLIKYPNSIIITFDDDVIYRTTIVEDLIKSYIKYPDCISCGRSHQITFNTKGILHSYKHWNTTLSSNEPSFNNFFTGVGGVLYPPNSLHKDIFNKNLFLSLAPNNDDIWFWAMATLNKSRTVTIDNKYLEFCYIPGSQEDSLFNINVINNDNDRQLKNVFDHYPTLLNQIAKIPQTDFNNLEKLLNETEKDNVVLWGASMFLEEFLKEYDCNFKNIVGIIDSNSNRKGLKLGEYQIFSPEDLTKLNANKIILTIKNNHEERHADVKQYLLKNNINISLLEDYFASPKKIKTAERLMPELYQSNVYDYILFLKHKFAYFLASKYIKSEDHVLEIGCGEGYGANFLAENTGAFIQAIDINTNAITNAQKQYIHKNVNFKTYDGKNIDYEDNSFDVIISFQVIEHIENTTEYLKNIKRLLKPNGIFLITTPSRTYRLADNQKPWNPYHIREYNSNTLTKDIKNVFDNINTYSITSIKEILDIEFERVRPNRSDYNNDVTIIPNITNDFLERYTLKDFYITQDLLDSGLDLLVSNKPL